MIKNSVLLILPAQNFNEQEYLVVCKSIENAHLSVFIASDAHSLCTGSNGLKVKNDVKFFNMHEKNFAGIVFIGGSGVKDYWNNSSLHSIAKKFKISGKPIGAICSSVIILAKAGILSGSATCWPDNMKELIKEGIEFKNEPVIKNGRTITGRDPQAATEFVKTFIYEIVK